MSDAAGATGVDRALEQLLAEGSARPACLVSDESPGWLHRAVAETATARTRGVVAVSGDRSLVAAQRLGFGGALWQPPSKASLRSALAAAASPWPLPVAPAEPCTGAMLAGAGPPWLVVTLHDRRFWLRHLGPLRLQGLLHELARGLEALPVLLSWPALVVAERTVADVETAWQRMTRRFPLAPAGALRVEPLADEPSPDRFDANVLNLLLRTDRGSHRGGPGRRWYPVLRLPDGARVGSWAIGGRPPSGEAGWYATPLFDSSEGMSWRVLDSGTERHVPNVHTAAEVERHAGGFAVRVAGWVAIRLRSATPAGLLVERLAAAAERFRLPLWVPNVDQPALDFLLRLGLPLWVDGPAVPTG